MFQERRETDEMDGDTGTGGAQPAKVRYNISWHHPRRGLRGRVLSKLVLVVVARSSLGRILQYVPPHLRNRIQQGAPVESGSSWADQAEEPRSVYTEFLGPSRRNSASGIFRNATD